MEPVQIKYSVHQNVVFCKRNADKASSTFPGTRNLCSTRKVKLMLDTSILRNYQVPLSTW